MKIIIKAGINKAISPSKEEQTITDLETLIKLGSSAAENSKLLSLTKNTVILKINTAIEPAIIPRNINPSDSTPPPNHKTIGKPKAEIVKVPNEAASILAVVSLVLSSLSSVMRAVRDE